MRFVLRQLSIVALAVAVIMAVVDATRSIAADEITLTPLVYSWREISPETFSLVEEAMRDSLFPLLWDPVAVSILALPGWLVFAVLAFLLYAAGRPRRRSGRAVSAL